ncbi:MAG TPA: hypothetical protein VMV57_04290 [Terracidiphilus sp.]|nr:hypothetical protein [Terracidiphilus sp.]
MSQKFWESDVEEELQPAEPTADAAAETEAVAISADDFSALEVRIVRAVELVKRERQARMEAEERAVRAEQQLGEQAPSVEKLKEEIRVLRRERDQVYQRVERLLSQLDSLEL